MTLPPWLHASAGLALAAALVAVCAAVLRLAWLRIEAREAPHRPGLDPARRSWRPDDQARLDSVLAAAEVRPEPSAEAPTDALEKAWAVLLASDEPASMDEPVRLLSACLRARPNDHRALAGLVVAAIAICRRRDAVPYRTGLRAAYPILQRALASAPTDPDVLALDAHVQLLLGEVDRADAQLAQLPSDQWLACVCRSRVYEIRGDRERAESALQAALALGPDAARDRLAAALEALAD